MSAHLKIGPSKTQTVITKSRKASPRRRDASTLVEQDTRPVLAFGVFSQRYERGSTIVTSNLPFDEWTSTFGSERLTGALLDRLTHHVHILEMNGESYRLKHSRQSAKT